MNEKISELNFDQIEIGTSKEFQITITDSMVNDFAKISGDFNPLHVDEKYAKSTKFGKRLVHGMLLASFLSQMVGMYLPGKNALYSSQTLEFHNPCFVGNEISVISKVIDKSQSTKIIKIESKISSDENKLLLYGIGRIVVRDD
jgi:acyl dehydratase